MRVAPAVLLIPALAGPAAAQEDVPPPPSGKPPAAASPSTPATSTPPARSMVVDEDRLALLIDRAVERAVERRMAERDRVERASYASSGATASPQLPTYAAPQSQTYTTTTPRVVRRIVAAEPTTEIEYVPALRRQSRYAQVLVPACRPRLALAAFGSRLVECGRPTVRQYELAPTTVSETVEYTTTTAQAPATYRSVAASPQVPTK